MKKLFLFALLICVLAHLAIPPASGLAQTPTITPAPSTYTYDEEQHDIIGLPGYWFVTIANNYLFEMSSGIPIAAGTHGVPGSFEGRLLDFGVTPAQICGSESQFAGFFENSYHATGVFAWGFGFYNANYTDSTWNIDIGETRSNDSHGLRLVAANYVEIADIPGHQQYLADALYADMPQYATWKQNNSLPQLNYVSKADVADYDQTYFYTYDWGNEIGQNSERISLQIICKGDKPAVGSSIGNVVLDGNMEQQPLSSFWFPNTGAGAGDFGRLDNSNLLQVGYGDPRCGNGWQIVGNTNVCSWSVLEFYNQSCAKSFAAIRQAISWPGGKMFYRFSAKAVPESGYDRQVNISIWITNKYTNVQTSLFTGMVAPDEWQDIAGSTGVSIPSGQYILNVAKGQGNSEYDAFYLDDIFIDTTNTPPTCQQVVIPATTSTPSSATATPTRTPTATPNGMAGTNTIYNCGFEQGEAYWDWQPSSSFVIYSGNNYAHIENGSSNPGVKQDFYWWGGTAYITFKTNTSYNVYLRSRETGMQYLVKSATSNTSNWQVIQGMVLNLPMGSYDINLHHPSGAGPSQFDDISVTAGNYASCTGGPNATPTAYPTNTPNATPTMWPTSTQKPTSTSQAGQPTSTARPTYTPVPSFTPRPTEAATNTPRPPVTATAYPTYTSQPTYTALPTYTPNAQGTIEPSPTPPPGLPTGAPSPQPPPAYYADCSRPQNGYDMAHWVEYEKCQTLSFFSMSPNAVSTVAAAPTLLAGREPFGTLGEVTDTNNRIIGLVNQQDWTESLDGMKDSPNPGMFTSPDGNSPWVTGKFDFSKKSAPISQECATSLKAVVGPYLAPGMCWSFNLLKQKGVLPWLQLIVNIFALATLGLYFWKKWVDGGIGG